MINQEELINRIEKIIPEAKRFRFGIKVNNKSQEVTISGNQGEEKTIDIENKDINQIILEARPWIVRTINESK